MTYNVFSGTLNPTHLLSPSSVVVVVAECCLLSLRTVTHHMVCLWQSEIGFGKLESYTKLDKLGEVSTTQ